MVTQRHSLQRWLLSVVNLICPITNLKGDFMDIRFSTLLGLLALICLIFAPWVFYDCRFPVYALGCVLVLLAVGFRLAND